MSAKLPRIFVHVGHGKTGTSATQNMLTLAAGDLERLGICYADRRDRDDALQGKISSGNIVWSANKKGLVKDSIKKVLRKRPGFDTYIFSSESLFAGIIEHLPSLRKEFASRYDLTIVISVREPVEMLQSNYDQAIKRSGFFGTIDEFAEREVHLSHAARIVSSCEAIGINVKIFNYSVLRQDISEHLFAFFGAPPTLFERIRKEVTTPVNRSLNCEERKLIMAINRVIGMAYGAKSSDALVERLPEVVAEPPQVSLSAEKRTIEQNASAASQINEFLPPEAAIRLKQGTSADAAEPARLMASQLDTVLEVFARDLQAFELLQRENEKLRKEMQHARKYPWKYLRTAWKLRFEKTS